MTVDSGIPPEWPADGGKSGWLIGLLAVVVGPVVRLALNGSQVSALSVRVDAESRRIDLLEQFAARHDVTANGLKDEVLMLRRKSDLLQEQLFDTISRMGLRH